VVNPEVCIITPISLDHTQALGCTIAQIANEKAGIIKPGSVVVSSPQLPEVDRIIEGVCRKNECKLIKVGADVMWQGENFDLSGQSFRVRGRRGSYRLNIPLLGGHQMKNATTAVAALEALAEVGIEILADNITAGLSRVNWPGRLQVLQQHPMLVVDGAHNVESARRLKEAISQYFDFDRLILVLGVSVDKDVAGIIRELAPLSHAVIVTRSRHPRSAPQAMLAGEFEGLGVKTQSTEDVASAVELALAVSGERDLICGTGSLFVAAEAIEYIERREVG
jgi:dihydrofolate synthase/folylpolyglutamate synthase